MLDDQIKKEADRLASLATKEPKKKVEGLIEYYKEPLSTRIVNALFENDLKTVASSVVNEVMIPKAKDILADMFISGIQKAIYGDEASSTYYSGYSKGPGHKASYDNYYKDGYRQPIAPVEKAKVHWDRIVFRDDPGDSGSGRRRAVELLNNLKSDLRRYGEGGVSVLEMYDYVTTIDEELGAQIESEFPDNNWGWTNLDHVPIEHVARGWWVKFPKPVRIN